MDKLDGKSMDIVSENIEKLRELFPEVFSEGKINFKKLEEELGQFTDSDAERYNFTWAGKSEAKRIAQTPSTGTLRPSLAESKNWDTTQNLYIEGDNLEVLKLLQKSYHKKVKMIYIDPPYNTGKDFVYPDNFHDNIQNYLEITGQVDSEGKKLSANAETNGRYHSDWLNMMYPRLKLARNMLKDDGVIFISIDDNEVANLRKVCDEIFGEDNFVAKLVHKNNSMKNQTKFIGVTTEYILIYAKSLEKLKEIDIEWRERKKGAKEIVSHFNKLKSKGLDLESIKEEIFDLYSKPKFSHISRWNKIDKDGIFMDDNLSREGGSKDYTIINPSTGKECPIPPRGWAKSYEELLKLQKENKIWYGNGETPPRIKSYLTEDTLSVPDNYCYYDTSSDKKLIDKLFEAQRIFEYPKSLELIQWLISLMNSDSLILDFFSGSATTAHAVMKLNSEDGGNRKFILVQLPESTDSTSEAYKAGYKNISEIGKERIRRAGDKIITDNPDKDLSELDIGFKVLKLDSSNIKAWDSDFDNLETNLLDAVDNIKSDRTAEDLLYEVLLKYGLDLTLPIEEKSINGSKVYVIGFGALIVCFDSHVTLDTVKHIAKLKEEYASEITRVVFKDSSFADTVVKTNALQELKQHGIDEVVSI